MLQMGILYGVFSFRDNKKTLDIASKDFIKNRNNFLCFSTSLT